MPAMQEPINLGDLLKYEAPNLYSRDRVTVAAGQTLPLGTVLGQITASQNAAMYFRMQRLYAAVEHFRKTGVIADLGDSEAGVA